MNTIRCMLLLCIISTSSCAGGIKDSYTSFIDVKSLSNIEDVNTTAPIVYPTRFLDRDIKQFLSMNYILLGMSSFTGEIASSGTIKSQARRIGATAALTSSTYAGTQTNNFTLLIPQSITTEHSGTLNSSYFNQQSGVTNSTGSFYGTSTTHYNKAVPVTINQHQYEQQAVFFVRSLVAPKFGIYLENVVPNNSASYTEPRGAIVNVVVFNSPCDSAGIHVDDLIANINGIDIINVGHAYEIMDSIQEDQSIVRFSVLRKGQRLNIEIKM